jgi:hypothetical protein
MSAESRKLVKATNNIAKDLGIRFCTHCNLTKSAHGGKIKFLANGRTRWMCAICAAKQKSSGFTYKKVG